MEIKTVFYIITLYYLFFVAALPVWVWIFSLLPKNIFKHINKPVNRPLSYLMLLMLLVYLITDKNEIIKNLFIILFFMYSILVYSGGIYSLKHKDSTWLSDEGDDAFTTSVMYLIMILIPHVIALYTIIFLDFP